MNNREAIQLNVLLRHFLRIEGGIRGDIPSRTEAREAAEYLADRANAALMAGLNAGKVAGAFRIQNQRKAR